MIATSALDERMREELRRIGRADLVVGIPSYNNASTVGHVARAVSTGLRGAFPGQRCAIVNSDGGSADGTVAAVVENAGEVPVVAGAYLGPPGKGSALRAVFECAAVLGARAGACVDSDLRSITPEWVRRLLEPVVDARADYVTPLYARHKHDGTITNKIAYPLTRALYGVRIRQPIGGEFGFSGELARRFLAGTAWKGADAEAAWGGDVARFGIDIYMTTTALVSGARVAQAFLGAKIHDPKDPGADLAPMFSEVVGTLFRLAAANEAHWRAVSGSVDARLIGDVTPVEPEPVSASADTLRRKHEAGTREHGAVWEEVLGRRPGVLGAREWAAAVYGFLAASRRDPERVDRYVAALVPLYFGRVARFIEDAAGLDTAGADGLVEEQALAFEELKGRLP
ncbi:glycosyltransferase [soil metagenome]